MEQRGSIFPHSVRGLKKTLITPKDLFSTTNRKTADNKYAFKNAFSKLTELLEVNANQSSANNNNNINSNSININRESQTKSGNNKETFLVSHKTILTPYRFYDEAKFSTKSYGSVVSYGVNTNQGIVRNYNEDRVSIILNVIKPPSRKNEEWPKVSFFGIFDGHGGTKCSDFLKDNLHHYV
jgi:hypothetical protein